MPPGAGPGSLRVIPANPSRVIRTSFIMSAWLRPSAKPGLRKPRDVHRIARSSGEPLRLARLPHVSWAFTAGTARGNAAPAAAGAGPFVAVSPHARKETPGHCGHRPVLTD